MQDTSSGMTKNCVLDMEKCIGSEENERMVVENARYKRGSSFIIRI